MLDDSTLLRQFAAERRPADFAELVQRHLGLVFRAALSRVNGDTHLAEDIAQEVFAALALEAVKVARHPSITGWLYVATRHAAANAQRSAQRRQRREEEAHRMHEADTPADSTANIDWEQVRPELDRVLDQLPEPDRQAVLLRFFGDQPFAEIGRTLNVSENAARMRVERALERLHGLLVSRGVATTATALAGLLSTQASAAVPATVATSIGTAALADAATASAASVSAVTFFQIMNTTKAVSAAAVVLLCGAIAVSVHENREAREARAALLVSEQRRATLHRRLIKAVAGVRSTNNLSGSYAHTTPVGPAEPARDDISPAGSSPALKTAGRRAAVSPLAQNPFDLAASNGEYRELFLAQQRAGYAKSYGPLYEHLRLTPDQIARFEELVLDQIRFLLDATAAAQAHGGSVTDPALVGVDAHEARKVDEQLVQLFGHEKFAEYVRWQKNGTNREHADELASKLYYTDTPLRREQAEKLTEVIAAHTTRGETHGLIGTGGKVDWPAVIAAAPAILSEPQLAKLRTSVHGYELDAEMTALMVRLGSQTATEDASPPARAAPPPN